MTFDQNLVISVILSIILFFLGNKLSGLLSKRSHRIILILLFFILCVPGLLFILYYTKIYGEPIWYFEFKSINNIELLTSCWGLLFGFLTAKRSDHNIFRTKRNIFLFLMCLLFVFIPFAKPILFPISHSVEFKDKWIDDVNIQSSGSTCGPSALATIFRYWGKQVTEDEIARACFTSRRGTENPYLMRFARKNGLNVELFYESNISKIQIPSILEVKVGRSGHFIVLLGREENKLVVGDPLKGRIKLTTEQFHETYGFEGFAMHIDIPRTNSIN